MNRSGDSDKEEEPDQLLQNHFKAKLRTWLFNTDPLNTSVAQAKSLEPAHNSKVLGNCESVRFTEIVFNATMAMHLYVGVFIILENKQRNQRTAELTYQSNPYRGSASRIPRKGIHYRVSNDRGLGKCMREATTQCQEIKPHPYIYFLYGLDAER